MAVRYSIVRCSIAVVSIALFAALAGCAQSTTTANLPPPRFDGPLVTQPQVAVVPTPAPRPLQLTAITPLPKPPAYRQVAGIPRDWIPQVEARPWRWIIIHHSATTFGSAAIIDRWHRERGFDELGYHFVIGNGTDSGDGQIEVGPRWPIQKHGAHDRTPDNRFNEYGIGICLVGNFDIQHPTPAQMHSLAKLVAYLMRTYHIPPDRVLGHGDTKATDCPGKNMSVAVVRSMAERLLADEGTPVYAEKTDQPGDELMTSDQLMTSIEEK
jgi:N-acetylmuramoyl-L-alanine amidase